MKMIYLTNRIIKFVAIVCTMIFCTNNYVCADNETKQYRIVNIERIGETFLIYAERNDSLFKIISELDLYQINTKSYYYKPLVIGKNYNLKLNVLDPISHFGVDVVGDSGCQLFFEDDMGIGRSVMIDSKSHYKIYSSKNTNGLYYLRPKE